MTTTLYASDLPTNAHHVVNYRVPKDTYVLKDNDRVYAEPGDHIHGYHGPDAIELCVYDAADCWPCASMAAQA